jgi:predicted phage-related endonuclease
MTAPDPSTAAVGEAAAVEDKPTVALPGDAGAWLGLIRRCDQQIKDLEETKRVARQRIEQLLGENEVGTLDGRPVVRWTVVPSRRFQQKKFQEQHPDLYEAFTSTSVSRRFTLVDQDEQ